MQYLKKKYVKTLKVKLFFSLVKKDKTIFKKFRNNLSKETLIVLANELQTELTKNGTSFENYVDLIKVLIEKNNKEPEIIEAKEIKEIGNRDVVSNKTKLQIL